MYVYTPNEFTASRLWVTAYNSNNKIQPHFKIIIDVIKNALISLLLVMC